MRDIALYAGVSLGNLYNYFESKESLITEIAVVETVDLQEHEAILSSNAEPGVVIEKIHSCVFENRISTGLCRALP